MITGIGRRIAVRVYPDGFRFGIWQLSDSYRIPTGYNGAFATPWPAAERGPRPQAAVRWPRMHFIRLATIPP
ncbi:hypothetical protein EMIT0111MI5_40507 [Burkholderia sp. IT-111MI5]